ncbi:hypothetical protein MRB53_041390 [Persea americana]|nr:hypothetical protein MRB53_041390 [Persea americana]
MDSESRLHDCCGRSLKCTNWPALVSQPRARLTANAFDGLRYETWESFKRGIYVAPTPCFGYTMTDVFVMEEGIQARKTWKNDGMDDIAERASWRCDASFSVRPLCVARPARTSRRGRQLFGRS